LIEKFGYKECPPLEARSDKDRSGGDK